jgi:hypothetical protein
MPRQHHETSGRHQESPLPHGEATASVPSSIRHRSRLPQPDLGQPVAGGAGPLPRRLPVPVRLRAQRLLPISSRCRTPAPPSRDRSDRAVVGSGARALRPDALSQREHRLHHDVRSGRAPPARRRVLQDGARRRDEPLAGRAAQWGSASHGSRPHRPLAPGAGGADPIGLPRSRRAHVVVAQDGRHALVTSTIAHAEVSILASVAYHRLLTGQFVSGELTVAIGAHRIPVRLDVSPDPAPPTAD